MNLRLGVLALVGALACEPPSADSSADASADQYVKKDAPARLDVSTCNSSVDFETDGWNCGRCGHSCVGGTCTAGVCGAVLADQYGRPYGVAVAKNRFYVGDMNGSIYSCPVDEGCNFNLNQVVPTSGPMEGFMAFDSAGTLYAATSTALWRVDGPVPTVLVSGSSRLSGVALTGSKIYFVDDAGLKLCDTPTCANPQPLYFGKGGIIGVATNGVTLYVTDYDGIYALDMQGKNAQQISTVGRPWGIAVDGATLYFTRYARDTLVACTAASCDTTRTVLFDGGLGALGYGVGFDAESVFVAEGHTSKVWRVAKP